MSQFVQMANSNVETENVLKRPSSVTTSLTVQTALMKMLAVSVSSEFYGVNFEEIAKIIMLFIRC